MRFEQRLAVAVVAFFALVVGIMIGMTLCGQRVKDGAEEKEDVRECRAQCVEMISNALDGCRAWKEGVEDE